MAWNRMVMGVVSGLTGAAACTLVLALGISLMTKSAGKGENAEEARERLKQKRQ